MTRVTDEPTDSKPKRLFLSAATAIALGLAVSGTVDRTTGGVLLLGGLITSLVALHRLGRAR